MGNRFGSSRTSALALWVTPSVRWLLAWGITALVSDPCQGACCRPQVILGSGQLSSSTSSKGAACSERLLETRRRLPWAAVSGSRPLLARSETLRPRSGDGGTETGIVMGFPPQPVPVWRGFGQHAKRPWAKTVRASW